MNILDEIRMAQRDAGEAIVMKHLERTKLSLYASAKETAALTRVATPDESWLETQLERIAPYRHEHGGPGDARAMEALVFELKRDRDHWRANHDAQVSRARVLIERTDMPLERVRAYNQMETLQADADRYQWIRTQIATDGKGLDVALSHLEYLIPEGESPTAEQWDAAVNSAMGISK